MSCEFPVCSIDRNGATPQIICWPLFRARIVNGKCPRCGKDNHNVMNGAETERTIPNEDPLEEPTTAIFGYFCCSCVSAIYQGTFFAVRDLDGNLINLTLEAMQQRGEEFEPAEIGVEEVSGTDWDSTGTSGTYDISYDNLSASSGTTDIGFTNDDSSSIIATADGMSVEQARASGFFFGFPTDFLINEPDEFGELLNMIRGWAGRCVQELGEVTVARANIGTIYAALSQAASGTGWYNAVMRTAYLIRNRLPLVSSRTVQTFVSVLYHGYRGMSHNHLEEARHYCTQVIQFLEGEGFTVSITDRPSP